MTIKPGDAISYRSAGGPYIEGRVETARALAPGYWWLEINLGRDHRGFDTIAHVGRPETMIKKHEPGA